MKMKLLPIMLICLSFSLGAQNETASQTGFSSYEDNFTGTITPKATAVTHPCITVQLATGSNHCSNQYEFPLGARIQMTDFCYVETRTSSTRDNCRTVFLGEGAPYYPLYADIKELRWYYDNQLLSTHVFNTTIDYQYEQNAPKNPKFYLDFRYPQCFTLNTEGEHEIRLEAYGGRMTIKGYNFVHPFYGDGGYGSLVKKIKVVDCNKRVSVKNKTDMGSNNGYTVQGGDVVVEPTGTIVINSGENRKIKAYNSIKLGPGFSVKQGATFSATTTRCPTYNCGCPKSEMETTAVQEPVAKTDAVEIEVYPNPANTSFYISMKEDMEFPVKMELYNNIGQVLKTVTLQDKLTKIDLDGLPSALYFVKIYGENGIYTKKLLKN